MPATRKPRIVIAGQAPPPMGGQNVMIARLLEDFRGDARFETKHLAFRFTPDFSTVRQGSGRKAVELVRVIARLLALRLRGPIDLLVFPAGGPQTVPLIRDVLLLPWILIAARRVVVQFHAAGLADCCADKRSLLCGAIRALYGRCHAAVVMTEFNRRDPLFAGIGRIAVIPHRLPDEFDPALVCKNSGQLRVLYVGHLCADKGTPALLRAFKVVAAREPRAVLELVGECLPPWSPGELRASIRDLGLEGRVECPGVLIGPAKQEAFGRADLFVFPSVAPYESFGLVMVEAMMWGLPIVATDWRGNRDVLGPDFEGICHPVGDDLAVSVADALLAVLGKKWSSRNRQLFLGRYVHGEADRDYGDIVESWLPSPPTV